jgi:hypothetical protein
MIYDVTNDPDLPIRGISFNAPKNATEEELLEALNNKKKEIEKAQRSLDTFKSGRTGRNKISDEQVKENLQELFSKAIGLANSSEFNIDKGASFGDRIALDFLPTNTDRRQYLEKKYGETNVGVLPFRGEETFFYRDPEDNKFRLVDEYGTGFADFTADIAAESLALGASAGALAFFPATAAAALTSLPAALATAGISSGSYALAKGASDVAARLATGDDVDFKDIGARRGKELLIQAPLDLATLRAAKLLRGAIPKEAKGAVVQEIKKIRDRTGVTVPQQMLSKNERPEVLRQIAEKAPDSELGKLFERNRDTLFKETEALFTGDPTGTLKNHYDDYLRKTKEGFNRITNKLDEVKKDISTVTGRKLSTSKAIIADRVQRGFNKDLMVKIDRLNAPEVIGMSPRESGLFIQGKIFSKLHKLERQRQALYGKVNQLMETVPVTADELNNALNKSFNNIKDFKDFDFVSDEGTREILSRFRPTKVKEGILTSMEKLDEFADAKSISFEQLDNVIKSIDNNIIYTPEGVNISNPNQAALSTLRKELDALRTAKIAEGGRGAKRAYQEANRFYKNTILPFRERFDSEVKLIGGQKRQTIFEQLDAFEAGKRKTSPFQRKGIFVKDGSKLLEEAFGATEKLQRYVDAADDNLDVKKILRKKWMETKNLEAKADLPSFKLKPKDLEIIEILWNKKKINDFRVVERQIGKKKGLVEFQTNRLFKELEKAETGLNEKQLRQLVDQEISLTRELDAFNKDLLKLVVDKDVPPPDDIAGFAKVLLGKKNQGKVVEQLYEAVGGPDSLNGVQLQEAMFEEILRRARKSDKSLIQEGAIDSITGKNSLLWDVNAMKTQLDKHEDILTQVWGKSKYDNFVLNNDGMKYFGIRKLGPKERADMRVGTAFSGQGRLSLFVTAIPSWISTKYTSNLWNAGGYNVLSKPVSSSIRATNKSVELFAKLMEGRIKTTMASEKGIANMLLSSENDPAFHDYIKLEYMRYLSDNDIDDLAEAEDIAAMQPQMRKEAPQEPAMAAPMQ